MNVKTLVPLVDLGTVKPEYRGIWSPQYDDALIQKFIHQFFQENAAVYAERYQATAHWKNLIQRAQNHFRLDAAQPCILDIGSGAGNSVFPLLDLYPQATIIASDLSVPLLKMLKDHLDRHYADRSCQVVQLNAEQLIFADNQFDLVCGGSILHHLFHPEKTIAECHRILKPGGAAIFFEPFEVGNQILALAFQHLLEMNRRRLIGVATRTPPPTANGRSLAGILTWLRWAKNWVLPLRLRRPIPPRVVRFFEDACTEYRLRKGREHDAVVLQHFEDKLLFTRRFFEEHARAAGFAAVVIESINEAAQQFTVQTRVMLRLGPALPETALPAWAWDYLGKMDQHFSSDLMSELLCEGLVVFRKPLALAGANRAA
jgi:ubiquinone/menaquinone biosynthesis C-methylase UbiE